MICFSFSLVGDTFGIGLMEALIYFTSYRINSTPCESQSNIKQAGSERRYFGVLQSQNLDIRQLVLLSPLPFLPLAQSKKGKNHHNTVSSNSKNRHFIFNEGCGELLENLSPRYLDDYRHGRLLFYRLPS